MTIKEVNYIMINGSKNEKIFLLSYLNDIFESYNKNIEDFVEIVQSLIELALNSNDDDIKVELLETICKAQTYQNIENISFEGFVEALNTVPIKFLARYIDILSYTSNKTYLPIILKFKNHEDKYVCQAVEDAIIELG